MGPRPRVCARTSTRGGAPQRRRSRRAAWGILAAAIAALALPAAGAADPPARGLEIVLKPPARLGGGDHLARAALPASADGEIVYFRPCAWFALAVHAANTGTAEVDADFRVRPIDLFGAPLGCFRSHHRFPASSRRVEFLYACAPPEACLLEVLVERPGESSAFRHPLAPLKPEIPAVLVSDPRGGARRFLSNDALWRGDVYLIRIDPVDLPERPEGFEAFDCAALPDDADLSPSQAAAVESWVAGGGRLLVYAGAGTVSHPLRRLLPFADPGTDAVTLPPGPESGELAGQRLELRRFAGSGVQALLRAGDRVLLARRPLGAGEVLALAANPSAPAVAAWGTGIRRLADHLQAVRGYSARDLAGTARADLLRRPCAPRVGPIAAFLLLWAVLFGPAGFFLLRRVGRPAAAFWIIVAAVAAGAAVSVSIGGRVMDSGPALSTFTVLRARAGAEAGTAETYVSSSRFSRVPVEIAGGEGELAAPLWPETPLESPSWEAWTDRRPRLVSGELPAGIPVFARRTQPKNGAVFRAELEILDAEDLTGAVDFGPLGVLPSKAFAVFGTAWYPLAPRPWSSAGSSLLAPSGRPARREDAPDPLRPPEKRARRLRRGPALAPDTRGLPPFSGSAWFDAESGRIALEGLLAARWAPEDAAKGAPDALVGRIRAWNASSRICIPCGILRARWTAEGPGAPRETDAGFELPPKASAAVEFVLPVPGRAIAFAELAVVFDVSTPDGSSTVRAAETRTLAAHDLRGSFYLWEEGSYEESESGMEAIHPDDGRVAWRFDNAGTEAVFLRNVGLRVRGALR